MGGKREPRVAGVWKEGLRKGHIRGGGGCLFPLFLSRKACPWGVVQALDGLTDLGKQQVLLAYRAKDLFLGRPQVPRG